jgi:hypothetical protein
MKELGLFFLHNINILLGMLIQKGAILLFNEITDLTSPYFMGFAGFAEK